MRRNKAYFLFAAALSIGVFGLTNEASASDGNSVNSYIENKIQSGAWGKANETNKINSVFPHYAYRNGVGKPEGFVVHESGTEGDRWSSSDVAMNNEENYMINNWDNAFTQGWVSDNRIDTIANTDYLAWGVAYTGNQRYIQYEQVRLNGKDQWAKQTYNIASIAAQKMLQYGIKPQLGSTLFSHAMISNIWHETSHTDPTGYWATQASSYFGTSYTMDNFAWLVNYIYNQNNYDKIQTHKSGYNYNIVVEQDSQNDGVYYDGPFNTSATTVTQNESGKNYNKKTGRVLEEAKTSRSTYVHVFIDNGRDFWIDKAAVRFVPDKIIKQSDTNYTAVIKQDGRNDGIYTDPFDTTVNAQLAVAMAPQYNGARVQVRKTVQTSRSTYVNAFIDGKWLWVDQGGVQKQNVADGWYTAPVGNKTNSDGTITTNKYYFKNGKQVFGEQQIGGKWYLFGKDGYMVTGLAKLSNHGVSDSKTVYYGADGTMQYGQHAINGKWYLFQNGTGAMVTGFQNLSSYGENKTVYYATNGAMQYGQQWINNKWYLLDSRTGQRLTGLQNLKNYGEDKTVYYDLTTGVMQYGTVTVNGKPMTFKAGTGELQTGWYVNAKKSETSVSGATVTNRYYVTRNGVLTGEQAIDGKWYLFNTDGYMVSGIAKLNQFGIKDDRTVYYDKSGAMQYGQQWIGGKWYLFDRQTGAMQTGLQNLVQYGEDKTVYYDTKSGVMQYGTVTVDGKAMNFKQGTGDLQTGWYTDKQRQVSQTSSAAITNKYYVTRNGIIKGESAIDGNWHLFNQSGYMVTGFAKLNQFGLSDNRVVYYNTNGVMQYGQQWIDNKWYLFDRQTGEMKTGLQNLSAYGENKTVYYGADGVMQYGQRAVNGGWYLFANSTGAMQTGVQDLTPYGEKKVVYYGTDGRMQYGQKYIDGKWYLFKNGTGERAIGFQNLKEYGDNKTVYYSPQNGAMLYGTQIIDGKKYTFDSNTGALIS